MIPTSHFVPQPYWFKTLNQLWRTTYLFGTETSLNKDDLIRRARRSTGLTDFGTDLWEEPLIRMLDSMNNEATLSPVGRFISRERLVNLLSIRLRATRYFNRFPEILEQELYPAWIIVGLQRTGTTKLQRLLASDHNHRVIPSWEAINPVPLTLYTKRHPYFEREQKEEAGKRIKLAETAVRVVKLISPGFFAVHPLDARLPEEDVLLLDISFMSTTTEAMMPVPTYSSWLESTDQSPAYAYYVKLLKLLQWLQPAKRWILKSPHHLEFPDLIAKHMNEVHFIWPHRTIYESIPSFLSMLTYNHMIFSDQVDIEDLGKRWIRKTGYVLDKVIDYRLTKKNEHRFTDIWYKDLILDSIQELSKIYALDGGLTPELIARFKTHEQIHPHRKFGKHHYALNDFNLTKKDIDKYTLHYQKFLGNRYDRKPAEKIQ